MPKRIFAAFEIEAHLKAGLEAVKERDGLPLNFQVSKAIQKWLEEKGVLGTAKLAGRKATPKGKRS